MALIWDDYEYAPAGTRDAAKTTSFFDSIQKLITPPKLALPTAPPAPSSGIWDNGNEWVNTPTGGHWRGADGRIWNDEAGWVEDPSAAIAAASRVGSSMSPQSPNTALLNSLPRDSIDSQYDPQFAGWQQWLNASSAGRAGSQYDRMGFDAPPTNSALLGYYGDQQARQQTLSQILGFAGKAAGATNFSSPPTYSLPPLDVSLNEVAANSQPADTGWGTAGRAAGGVGGALKGGYDWYNKNLATPFEETASQLTGPLLKFHQMASAAGAGIPGVAPAISGVSALTGWKPDMGGLGELAGSIKESGGNPIDFRDIQSRKFAERPTVQQGLASIVYDPSNVAGAGIGARALETGAVTSRLGRGLATADKMLDVAQTKAALPLIGGVAGGVGAAAMGEDWRGGALAGVAAGALAPALVKPVGKLTRGGFGGSVVEDVGRQGDMFAGSVPNPHLAGISPEAEAARKELLGNLQQNRIIRKAGTTGDEIATGRTRQVTGILGGLTEGEAAGLSGRELLDSMANGIPGGPLIQTTAGPLQLTPDIQDDMADIVTAWVKQDPAGRAYEARTARDTLDKIYAGRMPEPKEDELLRRIFGDDVTDAISGSRNLPIVKPDSEATSYPLDLGDQTVGVQPPLFGESGYVAPIHFTPEQRAAFADTVAKQAEEKAYWDEVFAERERQQAAATMDKFRANGETAGAPLDMSPQGTQMSLYEAERVVLTPEQRQFWDTLMANDAKGEPFDWKTVPPKLREWAEIVGLETLSAPRAIKSSMDLSAPLRQGAMLGWAHPKAAKDAFEAQMLAWRSEGNARKIDAALSARPNARIKRESGLYRAALNSADDGLTAQEEVFMSRIADKLPGVRHSERAYVTYLNVLRDDVWDTVWNGFPELEKTGQRAKDLSRFINVASGRGELGGKLTGSGPLLGAIFYAPRYMISRPQAIYLGLKTPGIRKEATKMMASYFAGTSTVLALGNAAGIWDVELDPRSSDFGKARVGPLRYDLWTGYSQLGRLMTQFSLAALEPLDGKGGIRIPNASKSTETGDTRDISATQPLSRFTRSKLAPGTGMLVNLISGTDYRGSPYKPTVGMSEFMPKDLDVALGVLTDLAAPLSLADFVRAWNQYGWEKAMATLPSFFGAGASVYDPQAVDALDKIAKQTEYADKDGNIVKGAKFYDLPAGTQGRIKEENPELAKKLDDSKTSAEAKANVAATRILMEQQDKADKALEKKDLHPKEWREQLGARQTELITRKDQIYINAGKKQGADPVLDGYFTSIEKATDELGQVDWGLVDAFRAGLSDSENKYLDDNTGLSLGTPVVKAYRADMDAIKNSGYWDIYDRAWSMYQEKYADHPTAQFASYQDWYESQVKTARDELLANGTFKPGEDVAALDAARGLVNKTGTAKAFTSTKDALKEDWVARHKEDGIAKKAFEWEYITADKYRKFLYGN